MRLEELKKCLEGMAEGPWKYEYSAPYEACFKTPKGHLDGIDVWLDDAPVHDFNSQVDKNAKGIAMLRNHADLFIKLLSACKDSERKWMAVDDGLFTGLVPPEFAEISQVIREIERVEP